MAREIFLHEDDPEMVGKMLRWCYAQDYDDEHDYKPKSYGISLVINARMYALADKYGLQGLKIHAITKYKTALLMCLFGELQDAFFEAIEVVFNTTPTSDRGLREIFLKWVQHPGNYLMFEPRFQELVKSGFVDGEFC